MEIDVKTKEKLAKFAYQLETTSLSGKITLGVLFFIIAWAFYALLIQFIDGHIVTGMRDNVVWGIYIVNFIFFIGISYAGALISGILHLLRVEWRKPIIRMAEIITVVSTMIGPIYILLCMGRLERLPNLLLFGRIQSPIIWDVIAITTYLVGSMIFLHMALIRDFAVLRDTSLKVGKWRYPIYRFFAAGFQDTPKQNRILDRATDVMAAIIIPLAVIVHSVLSWIFGMTLRPGWHSTIFAPYFVVAAVFSGTGALICVIWVFRKVYHLEEYILEKHFHYLGMILLILGALYGYFTFSEYLTSWYGSEKWELEVLHKLFSFDEYGWAFAIAAYIGILFPVVIMGFKRLRTINNIAFASLVTVAAMWIKRYLIIIPTLEAPLLPMQDTREEIIHYTATWVERVLTLGGVGFFILFFFLFSKFVPIIPIFDHKDTKYITVIKKEVKVKEIEYEETVEKQ